MGNEELEREVEGLTESERIEIRLKLAVEQKRRRERESIRYFRPKFYQDKFVLSAAQIDGVMGGNRSGKTICGAFRFTCIVLGEEGIKRYGLPRLPIEYPKPPFDCWVVSQDFPSSRDVVQPKIIEMIPATAIAPNGIRYREKGAIDYIKLRSGVRIIFKSCDSGWQKFQGAEIPVLWFDEEPDEMVFRECMIRIGRQKRYVVITMTPLQGFTWLVETLHDLAGDGTCELHEFFTEDNDSLEHGEIERIKKMYPEDEWITRLTGKPLVRSGLIYPEFRYDKHVYSEEMNFGEIFNWMQWYLFCDYGSQMPMAIYLAGVDARGLCYIHAEHYLSGASLEAHARGAKALYSQIPRENGRFKPGHEFITTIIDPSAYDGQKTHKNSIAIQFMNHLTQHGVETAVIKGINEVDLGIELMKNALRVRPEILDPFTGIPGAPSLFVNRLCQKWIWEIRRYRRHVSHSASMDSDKPRKKDDHAMDATRYGLTKIPTLYGNLATINDDFHPRQRNPVTGR